MGQAMDAGARIEASESAARAIAAATSQIDLALREAQGPVEALGATLERITEHMEALRSHFTVHLQHCADAHGTLEMDYAMQALSREMAMAVQSMQFYDRMFQHLSHVHDYLSGSAATLASSGESPIGSLAEEQDAERRWESLRERLFSRLLSDAQRQVLDIVLPPRHWDKSRRGNAKPMHVTSGEIELF
jgi:hypothetical protein